MMRQAVIPSLFPENISMTKLPIVSLFSGAGGLDLGFQKAGFDIIWANEYDKDIWDTYRTNHSNTILDTRSITEISQEEVPDCIGIIGGPPCQSWSEAGSRRGMNDKRGQLFYDFIRILTKKQPLFFLAENVSGMLANTHSEAFLNIQHLFAEAGYNLSVNLVNAHNYNVPQDRKRVIFVGYRKDLDKKFTLPSTIIPKPTLKDAIDDLKNTAVPALDKNYSNSNVKFPNHEYFIGGFSTIYMSRNRVRKWDEPSFTIQAGGRHAPMHPQAPKMRKIHTDEFIFEMSEKSLYRRLTIRECARIQTFPDSFIFVYKNVTAGYKMIGNAVPVNLAYHLATKIKKDLAL
ncbi:MAG: DNA cytosine methyltransferase [Akkermansia sp.]